MKIGPRKSDELLDAVQDIAPYWNLAKKYPKEWESLVNEYFTTKEDLRVSLAMYIQMSCIQRQTCVSNVIDAMLRGPMRAA